MALDEKEEEIFGEEVEEKIPNTVELFEEDDLVEGVVPDDVLVPVEINDEEEDVEEEDEEDGDEDEDDEDEDDEEFLDFDSFEDIDE